MLMKQIRIVRSRDTNKHTGYAFIVFEHERDMKSIISFFKSQVLLMEA